jgi:hypothetical protein
VDPELRRVELLLLPEPGSFGRRVEAAAAVPIAEPREHPAPRRASTRRPRAVRASAVVAAAVAVTWASASGPHGPRPTLVPVAPDVRIDTVRSRAFSFPANVESRAKTVQGHKAPKRARVVAKPAVRPRVGKAPDARPKQHVQPHPRSRRPATRPAVRRPAPRPFAKTPATRAKIAWRRVRGADYYNLIVWRQGQRVLDLWPSQNRALLPRTWSYEGKSRTLAPGRYLWFVYPGFGPKAQGRYGSQVQRGILVIDRK